MKPMLDECMMRLLRFGIQDRGYSSHFCVCHCSSVTWYAMYIGEMRSMLFALTYYSPFLRQIQNWNKINGDISSLPLLYIFSLPRAVGWFCHFSCSRSFPVSALTTFDLLVFYFHETCTRQNLKTQNFKTLHAYTLCYDCILLFFVENWYFVDLKSDANDEFLKNNNK